MNRSKEKIELTGNDFFVVVFFLGKTNCCHHEKSIGITGYSSIL